MGNSVFLDYRPLHDRLVCIDSDGCVFDTMEIKHKECFCPSMIQIWGLQPISKYAREAWEFANLYSKDRGRSRFIDLVKTFDLLEDWDEVKEYEFSFPDIGSLRRWVDSSPILNQGALKDSDDPVLLRTLQWSLDCNKRIAEMVKGIPPFPGAGESIRRLSQKADIAIVSATAKDALLREWKEHGLLSYVRILCSQEEGSKSQCIEALKGHYQKGNILMVGDAPGDQEAAHTNGALFYPIRPGQEIASWKEFLDVGMECFLRGEYTKEREEACISRFDDCLPEIPWWKKGKPAEKGFSAGI